MRAAFDRKHGGEIDYKKLEGAIKDALLIEVRVEPKFHPVAVDSKGDMDIILSDPEEYKVDPTDIKDDCLPYSTRSAHPRRLVHKSICAQAAAWNVSLLVDFSDLNSRKERSPEKKPLSETEEHLLQIRVERKRGQDHELAVPVRDALGRMEAVIGLNSKTKLKSEHVRRVELVIQLYQQLRAIHCLGDERAIRFIDQLEDLGEMPGTSFQNVAKRFNEWVLELLDADLVYLSLYHGAHDVFRMMGVSIHTRLYRAWLKHPHELNTFLGTFDDTSSLRSLLLQQVPDSPNDDPDKQGFPNLSPLHQRLLEHALITRLRPRGSPTRARGLTWDIFTGSRTPPYVFDPPKDFLPSARYYTETIYARPFVATPESRPDGVLWIGWQKKRPLSAFGPANELPDRDKEAVLQQVQQLAAVVYSISQYYDPDEVLDPLPFRAES